MAAVLEKDEKYANLIAKMTTEGKISPKVAYYIGLENICAAYMVTPSQVREEDLETMNIFRAIGRGRKKARDKTDG